MRLIDSHTHLYLEQFDEDRAELISKAGEFGIDRFLLPHIDSETTQAMYDLVKQYPDKCFPMMGLHPCSVKENFEEELALVKELLFSKEHVAVGEIGLDHYWDKTFVDQQRDAFIRQIHWANELDLPIVIHSRETIDLLIEVLEKEAIEGLKGVFHCFTGSVEQAERILALGFYLGIGGVLTFKNSGLDKTVKELPIESMILETDAPYLTPTPHRGKRNIPEYLYLVAQKLAEVKEIDIEIVANVTTENSCHLFNLPR